LTFAPTSNYDRAMLEILADNNSIELHPSLRQSVPLDCGESVGYKVRHVDNPHCVGSVVLHPSAFDLVDGEERLSSIASRNAKCSLAVLYQSDSSHELIEIR
jgi:hypothetical protein